MRGYVLRTVSRSIFRPVATKHSYGPWRECPLVRRRCRPACGCEGGHVVYLGHFAGDGTVEPPLRWGEVYGRCFLGPVSVPYFVLLRRN
jgi:hypothetical protein